MIAQAYVEVCLDHLRIDCYSKADALYGAGASHHWALAEQVYTLHRRDLCARFGLEHTVSPDRPYLKLHSGAVG